VTEVPTDSKQPGINVLSPEERIATEILEHDEKLREISRKEASQRLRIRKLSIFACGLVFVGMGAVLFLASYKVFLSPDIEISMAYIIAVFIAPIVSITAIAIGLLIAAFRKFRDVDDTAGMSVATGAARVGSSLG